MKKRMAVLALLALFGLAACGDDDGGSVTGTSDGSSSTGSAGSSSGSASTAE